MTYTKTPKILAGIEARKNLFLAAATEIVGKEGIAGLTVATVAEHSGQSVGLIYRYFADMHELIAAMVQQQLDQHVAAIRKGTTPGAPLASALAVYYSLLKKPKLVHMLMGHPIYLIGIRNEVARLIDVPTVLPKQRQQAATAAVGALIALALSNDGAQGRSQAALLFALRGIGYGDAGARRAMERV
jgi:AcrR family transcriptional regulator